MPAKVLKTLDVRSRRLWRQWLEKHHDSESEIWLVFHKRHTGEKFIDLGDAVEEALCFGWIDSLVKRWTTTAMRGSSLREARQPLVHQQSPTLRGPRGTRVTGSAGAGSAAHEQERRCPASVPIRDPV